MRRFPSLPHTVACHGVFPPCERCRGRGGKFRASVEIGFLCGGEQHCLHWWHLKMRKISKTIYRKANSGPRRSKKCAKFCISLTWWCFCRYHRSCAVLPAVDSYPVRSNAMRRYQLPFSSAEQQKILSDFRNTFVVITPHSTAPGALIPWEFSLFLPSFPKYRCLYFCLFLTKHACLELKFCEGATFETQFFSILLYLNKFDSDR